MTEALSSVNRFCDDSRRASNSLDKASALLASSETETYGDGLNGGRDGGNGSSALDSSAFLDGKSCDDSLRASKPLAIPSALTRSVRPPSWPLPPPQVFRSLDNALNTLHNRI